jgi:uncharacterized protein (TIGR02145 family)
MNSSTPRLLLICWFISSLFIIACKKSEVPELTTFPISLITTTTAQSGGEIISNGGEAIQTKGVIWGILADLTLVNCVGKTTDGSGEGVFVSELMNLTPGTTYYVRAYATNGVGTGYGQTIEFTTHIDSSLLPIITTDSITYILHNSSIAHSNLISAGGAPITHWGVCLNTSGNPDITDTYTTQSGQPGAFRDTLTGLLPSTTYYVRAYATSNVGTSYGSELKFTTLGPLTGDPCPGTPIVTDYNGNVYGTVQIGSQCWMRENLRVRNFNDGISIPNVTIDSIWYNHLNYKPTPARCWCQNDSMAYAELYGGLYNGYAVMTGKLCPPGWHVPTKTEWETLRNYLGGPNIAGGSLKATVHWQSPNTGATNASGFTGLPAGARSPFTGGGFVGFGEASGWWSSTIYIPVGTVETWFHSITYQTEKFQSTAMSNPAGLAVRCIKSN